MQLQKNDGPKKKYGTPNPLNIEWTRNAEIAKKWEKKKNIRIRPSVSTEK